MATKDANFSLRRRRIVLASAATVTAAVFIQLNGGGTRKALAAATEKAFEVQRTDAQWRALLTPEQYTVMRQEGTEHAFTSPLDHEKRVGTFSCAGCKLDLYSSATKFDSGTGWPSFWKPLPNAVSDSRDYSLGMERDEIHCRRCGSHLGHVFDDGPAPTGLRYCMNGVAMNFRPAA